MPCRRDPVVLVFAAGLLLTAAGSARAHRLLVDCHVKPGGEVQVESWFDIGADPAREARVVVYGTNDEVRAAGTTNQRGIFVFQAKSAEPLRVVVEAGAAQAGHRAEERIPAERLAAALGETAASAQSESRGTGPTPLSDRSSRVSPRDVVSGIAFLLALAAFVLSIRNRRQLAQLRRRDEPAPGQES